MKQLITGYLLATLLISACQPIQAPATMQGEFATNVARAAMPLPQLSPQQAAELVINHLDNRTRSRHSRLSSASSH